MACSALYKTFNTNITNMTAAPLRHPVLIRIILYQAKSDLNPALPTSFILTTVIDNIIDASRNIFISSIGLIQSANHLITFRSNKSSSTAIIPSSFPNPSLSRPAPNSPMRSLKPKVSPTASPVHSCSPPSSAKISEA